MERNNTPTMCIYHSRDLDGWMSAAIVKTAYSNINLVGWDYGNDLPELPNQHIQVIMVDVSFPAHNMRHLQEKNSLIWIDHHVSAIKEMNDAGLDPNGKRDSKKAACELTWEYLHGSQPMPEIVRLLGRYDCFGHKGTDEEQKVLEFQYAARAFLNGVDDCYKQLNSPSYDDYFEKGEAIYSYLCMDAKQIYERRFLIVLDGYFFACVNQQRFNPINFGINYHNDKATDNYWYDGFACFHYENGQFTYSLYNDNGMVDCSVIAKNRGGGGHKGASGFRSDTIIEPAKS